MRATERATWANEDLFNSHQSNFQIPYDSLLRVVTNSYGLVTIFTDSHIHKFTLMEKKNLQQYGQSLQPILADKLKMT